jgi:hypothetical protein
MPLPMQGRFDQLTIQIQDESQSIPLDGNCFGWIAVNKGDSVCVVDNIELKGFPTGHPEIEGSSVGIVHPLGLPFMKRQLTIAFRAGGTVNAVQITQMINY